MGSGERCLKQLIVTADDFGLSAPINEAVESAHTAGILTTTSLMVAAEAAGDAVARARRIPTLAVGLHLVVVDGQSVLPRPEIPGLVDKDGWFSGCLACAGIRYFFLPGVRRQLEAEIRAQFIAFQQTGLPLDHVNAHHHMHLHPTVLGLLIKVGKEFGLQAVRLPQEPLYNKGRLNWTRLLLSPWLALMKLRLRWAGLRYNSCIFGLSESGRMDLGTLLDTLQRLPEGISEIFFHPATQDQIAGSMPESDYCYTAEHAALIHPQCLAAVQDLGINLVSFTDLE